MKTLITVIIVLASLSGCSTLTPAKQIETIPVNKPVPYVPLPPDVPRFVSQIDRLDMIKDKNNPGKVVQAYKHDVAALRTVNRIQQMIIDQYRTSAIDFEPVNLEIARAYAQLQSLESPNK